MKEHILHLLEKEGMRIDRRKPLEYRPISIEKGMYKNAEGSALARVGKTKVLAGVKMSVGEPFPDSPDEGILITNTEFAPLASKEFEPGPPSYEAIEVARVIDRGIRESGAINFSNLCIEGGEKVWKVSLDLYVLDHDGNLIDAAGLAAISALVNAKIPKYDEEKGKVIYEERKENLEIENYPVINTFVMVDGNLLLDPIKDEEDISNARFSVTTTEEGFHSLQLGKAGGMKTPRINECLDLAEKKGKAIRNRLNLEG